MFRMRLTLAFGCSISDVEYLDIFPFITLLHCLNFRNYIRDHEATPTFFSTMESTISADLTNTRFMCVQCIPRGICLSGV